MGTITKQLYIVLLGKKSNKASIKILLDKSIGIFVNKDHYIIKQNLDRFPNTENDRRRFEKAKERREIRLVSRAK